VIRGAKIHLGSAEMAKDSANFCPKYKHPSMRKIEFRGIIYRVFGSPLNLYIIQITHGFPEVKEILLDGMEHKPWAKREGMLSMIK
jgi:hypothetical protein